MIKKTFTLCVCIIIITGCSSNQNRKFRPAQLQDNYENCLEKPLLERIGEIPEILLADLSKMDATNNYTNYTLNPDEQKIVENILLQAPDYLVDTLTTEVNGIYFVDNFMGGGMTYLIWKDGHAKYVLIFNPKTLHETLSDWLTYRDNTAFDQNEKLYSLRENESGTHGGFLHTCIHEACHVYDFSQGISANIDLSLTPVSKEIWQDRFTVHEQFDFPSRKKLSFYDLKPTEKVKLSDFIADFDSFARLPYASIYGSSNSLDEFAENETYKIFQDNYGITVTLEIISNNEIVKKYIPTNNPKVLERNVRFHKNCITGSQ